MGTMLFPWLVKDFKKTPPAPNKKPDKSIKNGPQSSFQNLRTLRLFEPKPEKKKKQSAEEFQVKPIFFFTNSKKGSLGSYAFNFSTCFTLVFFSLGKRFAKKCFSSWRHHSCKHARDLTIVVEIVKTECLPSNCFGNSF